MRAALITAGLNAADKFLPRGWLPSLAPAALVAASGTTPNEAAREGLARLMAAVAEDTELSLFGHLALRWDVLRLLRNAQMVEDAHKTRPELTAAPIAAPLFILGLPRSGTSFLHGLMAQDPQNAVPRNWQTIFPALRPQNFNPAQDKRARIVDGQLKLFADLAPGFAAIHPMSADSPQECSEITAHVFQSLRFDTTHRVPDYLAWLEAHGHDAALTFHRKFLQFLQDGRPARWVLKCPDHSFTLSAILRAYPDARFIIVHRDPLAVLGSVAHLTEVLRRPFVKNIDAAEIGAQVAARWTQGAELLLQFDQNRHIAPERKFHLQYEELVAAPEAAICRIYAQFGLNLAPAARAAMALQLSARPQGGYGWHAPYRLENFALSPQKLRRQFAPYVRRYCQAAE